MDDDPLDALARALDEEETATARHRCAIMALVQAEEAAEDRPDDAVLAAEVERCAAASAAAEDELRAARERRVAIEGAMNRKDVIETYRRRFGLGARGTAE